jgi:hypothetical protein
MRYLAMSSPFVDPTSPHPFGVRVLFAGSVMLGSRVAPVVAHGIHAEIVLRQEQDLLVGEVVKVGPDIGHHARRDVLGVFFDVGHHWWDALALPLPWPSTRIAPAGRNASAISRQ